MKIIMSEGSPNKHGSPNITAEKYAAGERNEKQQKLTNSFKLSLTKRKAVLNKLTALYQPYEHR